MSPERPARILLLEDSPIDAELIQRELGRRLGPHETAWVRDRESFTRVLAAFKPDLVLADHSLPDIDGGEALALVRRSDPSLPFIYVSGSIGEDRAVEALHDGATDYILKGKLARLVPAVERALREARERAIAQRVEQQFLQAQKMEAVGALAGGIAHDFNNLLMVISGNIELALEDLPAGSETHDRLQDVQHAVQRATTLTQQLLAFSRRQIVRPRIVNLDEAVSALDRLLRRVLREDIDLSTRTGGAGNVLIDVGQLDQVVMNLAVNARDAMPAGGRLTLETSRVVLGEDDAVIALGLKPGPHAVLAVSDTGIGMDPATLSRAFEPFFTTKGEGRGTGLGLATTYGILKQAGGAIVAYTEPGHGSTFRVYLPSAMDPLDESPSPAREADVAAAPVQGATLLLVEDNDQLRALAARILRRNGYVVLEAAHPEQALGICRAGATKIDLLVTDVVMPDMNGRVLAGLAEASCPGLRVLYMSGYTEHAVVRQGVLDAGIHFLQKPFAPEDLLRKVREMLAEG